jgi:hypothetical protein
MIILFDGINLFFLIFVVKEQNTQQGRGSEQNMRIGRAASVSSTYTSRLVLSENGGMSDD